MAGHAANSSKGKSARRKVGSNSEDIKEHKALPLSYLQISIIITIHQVIDTSGD